MKTDKFAILMAVLAAVLYAVNVPFSKLLLNYVSPTMMAAFLYIGAGIGMAVMMFVRNRVKHGNKSEVSLVKADFPYAFMMVVLDILAPILMMFGLRMTAASNASLLNNFEIVATALIALLFFHEEVKCRLWIAIGFVTVACILLSLDSVEAFSFSWGSLFVIGATVCWGLENNCTRQIADKDPMQIVTVKGFGSGLGALLVAFTIGESLPCFAHVVLIVLLGYVSYGLSIYVYTYAQRYIGAAKTSTYYAVAPFVGAFISILFLDDCLSWTFIVAIVFMAVGTWLASK